MQDTNYKGSSSWQNIDANIDVKLPFHHKNTRNSFWGGFCALEKSLVTVYYPPTFQELWGKAAVLSTSDGKC